MKVQGYIISMARAEKRLEHVRRIMAECTLEYHRFDAIDGRQLTDAAIDKVYRRGFHQPSYPFDLTRGEIGCFLSHRSVWKKIAEGDSPGALVLEDDIEILPGFGEALRFAVEAAPPCSYVQFQTRELKGAYQEIAFSKDHQLVLPKITPLRATAQWITRQAATQLVEATEVFDRPIDTFVQMRWLHGVEVLVVTPPCVREISGELGGSVINEPKPKKFRLPKLSRDFKRLVYRKQVQICSRNAA